MLRMYDTSNPYVWRYYETVPFSGARWTITDATLSLDNKMIAYCSLGSIVHTTNTSGNGETIPHYFNTYTGHNQRPWFGVCITPGCWVANLTKAIHTPRSCLFDFLVMGES